MYSECQSFLALSLFSLVLLTYRVYDILVASCAIVNYYAVVSICLVQLNCE